MAKSSQCKYEKGVVVDCHSRSTFRRSTYFFRWSVEYW